MTAVAIRSLPIFFTFETFYPDSEHQELLLDRQGNTDELRTRTAATIPWESRAYLHLSMQAKVLAQSQKGPNSVVGKLRTRNRIRPNCYTTNFVTNVTKDCDGCHWWNTRPKNPRNRHWRASGILFFWTPDKWHLPSNMWSMWRRVEVRRMNLTLFPAWA